MKYKNNTKYQNSASSRKKVALVLLACAVVGSIAGIYIIKKRNGDTSPSQPNSGQTINYAPSTAEEKKDAENNKDRIVKDQQKTNPGTAEPTSTASIKEVTPIITNPVGAISSASASSVNAYVPGIFEENGTCSAIFTKGSTVLTKQSVGFENVSNTQCAPISIDPGFLSAGQWSLVVKYSSTKANGTSAETKVEVN